ncbi:RagB/SusD family nutrient uptake outer membrane protein [Niastella caeni]|uniref:RagB/SusD family nutrient uptake outer membrane protein n=1 Tax=Niastella caeni TaxID=2569763 RepID=A0A4S8HSH3_9BACT|nr:RagB/SusD family nutrient uptake outer membrane protein [Niastella caeni]THU36062.1 RagB/SusD family nutrient uptake outer membrane protein [Niastella caeni]
MRGSIIKRYSILLVTVACVSAISSCKKIFDVEPENAVDKTQMYRNVFDADAAVIGVYGKLMKLAKPYILLNELRGDLMDVTLNADENLQQLNTHSAKADNPYIDPRPFYDVIINCNDVLYNFDIMISESKLKDIEYRQRYSDVASIRSWVYLQLGIHFGEIPYVTSPLEEASDLNDMSKFPMVKLEALIDSLVSFTEKLPFTEDYPTGTTLMTTVDGYSTSRFFINKNILLGDLYLWDGQYDKAADRYKRVMEINGPSGNSEAFFNQYRISSFSDAGIFYTRAQDFSSLVYTPGWRYLFERSQDNQFNYEWIWVLPFDKNFEPQNPLIDLFSPNGGSYLVKPSQLAMDNWNSQTQVFTYASGTSTAAAVLRDNFPLDSRGLFTWRTINGQPVIMKYLYNYLGTNLLPINSFNKAGKWFLTRAATLHLHYAEAANRAGKMKVAYALTNRGIKETYDTLPGAARTRDVTKWQQTFLPYPYDFDAREGDAPSYRNNWYRNQGIRGRAALRSAKFDSARYFNLAASGFNKPLSDSLGFQQFVENMIIDENALELAYEGNRWPDLVRVALRKNDPSYLANKIATKFERAGNPGLAASIRAKLSNKDNWFLPFKWK